MTKLPKRGPIVNWPITRERYRQVLLKMHRNWRKSEEQRQKLQLAIETLERIAYEALPEVADAEFYAGRTDLVDIVTNDVVMARHVLKAIRGEK